MNPRPNNLLLVSSSPQAHSWGETLSGAGWHVSLCHSMDDLTMEDSRSYQVIVIHTTGEELENKITLFNRHRQGDVAAILPLLTDTSPEQLLALFRLGVTDVLLMPFTDSELVETLNRVSTHKNLYLENLEYSRELERANKELQESLNILKMDQLAGRQVQKNLLPQSPFAFRDYNVSHTIIPSLYLSGDFVDYSLVFDRFFLFYIADVSGHGASSAFVTVLLRFILKKIISKHLRENDVEALTRAPEGFIEHVNRQICATGLEKQVSMFAGAIDMKTDMLRYSVAAQMPMPVFVSGTDARFLPGKGKIIGLFDNPTWEIEEIHLPKNFRLVMVSDGLLETLPGENMLEREKSLIRILSEHNRDHEAIRLALGLDAINEAIDDISMLSICRGDAQ